MVNLVENLLSTSSNRLLYETLWNLAITKSFKPGKFENLSIAQICNDLIVEISRDDPSRRNFYFSTQLTFGCVQLYRHQIEKLLNQAKNTCKSCVTTFYNINWQEELTQSVLSNDYDYISMKQKEPKQQTKQNVAKKQQSKKQINESQLYSIEQAFYIPQDELKSLNYDDMDPTMATKTITIMENIETTNIDFRTLIGEEIDEFGMFDQQEMEPLFRVPSHRHLIEEKAPESDQQVPEIMQSDEIPVILNEFEQCNPEKIPDLCDDVHDIIKKQMPLRKRRLSFTADISERIGAAKVSRLDSTNQEVVIDLPTNVSPFEDIANEIETIGQDLTTAEPAVDPIKSEKLSSFLKASSKSKKAGIIVDKAIKISNEVMKSNAVNYKEKLTNTPLFESWHQNMAKLKLSEKNYWKVPSSRMKTASKLLMPVFERNLAKVSMKLLKRRVSNDLEEAATSPVKKYKLRNANKQQLQLTQSVPVIGEMDLPPLEEFVKEVNHINIPPIEEVDQLNIPPIEDQLSLPQVKEVRNGDKSGSKAHGTKTPDYCSDEKWSKHQIMQKLNALWNRGDDPIKVTSLHFKNRFVAAGVFFELMVLSKAGAIELVTQSNLGIANIMRGQYAEIYM